jgi:hypothetical protein
MEVTYTLTPDDLWAFQRFHAQRRAKWRGLTQFSNILLVGTWIVQLLLIVRIAYGLRYLLAFGPHVWGFVLHHHQHLLLNFLIFSLFLVYLLFGPRFLAMRQAPSAAVLSQPKQMRIGPEGVQVVTAQEQVRRAWSDIPDIGSDRDCVFLYLTPTTALIVPRRAFATPQQSQVFEAQARAFRADPYPAAAQKTDTAVNDAVWPPRPSMSTTSEPLPAPAPELEDVPGALRVSYVTTRADLMRSQVVFLPRQPLALLSIFIPYIFAAGIWTMMHLPPAAAIVWAVVVAAVGTVLTVAWATQKTLTQRFARFAEGRPCETIARPDLLCDVTPEGRKIYHWPDVAAIQMRFGDVYVLTKGAGGMVIPRSAFPDKAAAEAWTQQLREFWRQGKDAPLAQPSAPTHSSQIKNSLMQRKGNR